MELSHQCSMLQAETSFAARQAVERLQKQVQTCGGLMTAAKESTLNMPRLEMVKVPPLISSGPSLPSLAYTHKMPLITALVDILWKEKEGAFSMLWPAN